MSGFFNQKGFTLIEVLVSMMIMAGSFVIIMGLFSGGLQSKQRARDFTMAVDLARNKMESTLLSDTFDPGITQGEFENGYRWKVEISKFVEEEASESDIIIKPDVSLFSILVEIIWDNSNQEKSYSLYAIHSQKQ